MTHSEAREGVASPRQGEVVCRECHGPVSLCRCGYESPAPSPASPTEERRVLAKGWMAFHSGGKHDGRCACILYDRRDTCEAWFPVTEFRAVYVEVVAVPPGEE